MKKSICVLLVALGMVLAGQTAFADIDADMNTLVAAFDDDTYSPATADLDQNGMLDSDEFAFMAAVIAGGTPASVGTAYATNVAIMHQVFDPAAIMYGADNIAALCNMLGAYATVGDASKLAFLQVTFTDGFNGVFATAWPTVSANIVTSNSSLLGGAADFDSDTLTNKAEYDAIAGTGGPSSAKRTSYVTNAKTYTYVSTDLVVTISISPRATLFEGQTATLTAVVGNGTGTKTVKWYKGATEVHTGLTLPLTGALTDSGVYTAVVTDQSTPMASDTSNAITVNVLAAANLPVMGVAGLALLAGLAGALGVRKIRK